MKPTSGYRVLQWLGHSPNMYGNVKSCASYNYSQHFLTSLMSNQSNRMVTCVTQTEKWRQVEVVIDWTLGENMGLCFRSNASSCLLSQVLSYILSALYVFVNHVWAVVIMLFFLGLYYICHLWIETHVQLPRHNASFLVLLG